MRVRGLGCVVGTVGLAVLLVAAGAAAQSPSASVSASPGGWAREVLAATSLGEPSFDDLILARYRLEPGVTTPALLRQGVLAATVETGRLELRMIQGETWITSSTGDEGRRILEGSSGIVEPGMRMTLGSASISVWRTVGDEPVMLLASQIVPAGEEPEAEVPPEPIPDPDPAGRVQATFVARGTGPYGQPSRITVLDRSGRVMGVRIPTERELRFWSPLPGDGAGPLAFIERGRHELLVSWSGTPCGPIVTLDVGEDLRAMRLVDRTPGCDASAVGHAVVLRLRLAGWFDPQRISITRVRRLPR